MADPTVTAVSADEAIRLVDLVRGYIPVRTSGLDDACMKIKEALRARSALADVGECETCRGKGYTEDDSDTQFRTSEHYPRCEACNGTGKQPRPALAKCVCGHAKMPGLTRCLNCNDLSPATHTAQVTEEVMEDLPSRPPNKVADLLTLWSKEYLDDRGMVFASSLCDDAAAYLRHYATLRRLAEQGSGAKP